MPRAALYLRVSTHDQTTANQRPALLQLAEARRLTIAETFEEVRSTSKRGRAPALARLVAAAHRGEFDCVLVWALDRLDRSMPATVALVLELDRLGVALVSHRETWLDTSGPTRGLLVAIMGWVAEQERVRLGERTRAGLERVRASGKHIGRPAARLDMREARRMMGEGMSMRATASALGVDDATLRRRLRGEKDVAPVGT